MVLQIKNQNLEGLLSTRLKYSQVSYFGYLRQTQGLVKNPNSLLQLYVFVTLNLKSQNPSVKFHCLCLVLWIHKPGSIILDFCTVTKFIVQILLIRDMVVECWNRRFGFETIHPTQKFTSMNLL